MYKQIEGFLSAEEAADELVRYATLVAKSIKGDARHLACIQIVGLQALTDLLDQYAKQKPEEKGE